ncbi:hypothetical protein niasHT_010528 [Heterodera trifolii]|uniref:Uncharacterized protein n=1 Tax=Heterodera trifolii TaxID=157864 RepID=A0ABD2L2E7_9BILA
MSAVPLDTIFGEMGAEKENANNTKPRSSTKKVPAATLPEVQIEHRLTREMVKEMITEAIKGLKAEITPKMGDIAQSVVRIADALEEAEARGCFERMSLDEKEGPVIGTEGQKEESEVPGSEVKNGEGQGAIERDPTQGGQKAEHQPNVSDCHAPRTKILSRRSPRRDTQKLEPRRWFSAIFPQLRILFMRFFYYFQLLLISIKCHEFLVKHYE